MDASSLDSPRLRFVASLPQQCPQHTALPVARSSSRSELLVDPQGNPVWPIADPEDKWVLSKVIHLFGGVEEAVAAESTNVPNSGGGGSVTGIGELHEEASLYAHLTGREAATCESEEALDPDALPDVLLYCGPRLSRAVVQAVQLAPLGSPPVGLIWGRSREELYLRLLSCACATYLNRPSKVPELLISEAGLGNGAEGHESVARLRERLGEGVGILRIEGHSDGLFQWLGHSAALCSRASEPEAGDPKAAPQCLATNFCHRLGEPLDVVSREGRLIPPASLSARVVILLSCHSAFLGASSVDSAWGMLPGLATNPFIGALLATPNISFHFEEIIGKELHQFLSEGFTIGETLVKLKENPTMEEIGYRPLLFGDPMVRGGNGSSSSLWSRDTNSRQPAPAASPAILNDPEGSKLELIRRLGYVVPPKNGAAAGTAEALRSRLHEYELAGPGDARSREAELQNAVLRHLARTKVRLFEGWQGASHIEELDEMEACPNCAWISRPKFITLPSGLEREYLDCPSCGDVVDQPVEDARLKMSADSTSFQLSEDVDRARAAAAAYVVRLEPGETQTLLWPRSDDRLLHPQMTVDLDALEQGPVKIYAVLMDDLSLYSQAFRARGGASPPPSP